MNPETLHKRPRRGPKPRPDAMRANLVIRIGPALDRALRDSAADQGIKPTVLARDILTAALTPPESPPTAR